jgi:hypothetical protein
MSTEIVECILLKRGDLVEGVVVWPHPFLDGFTEIDEELCVVCPISTEGNLEKSSDDTGCVLPGQLIFGEVNMSAYLSDICGIRDKGKVFQEHFRDMRL